MSGRKILVIDDEPQIIEVLTSYLKKDGFRVIAAADGTKALQIAEREEPDLILLDLMLPDIDGYEVCRALRKRSNVPIVMLTARDEETDKIVGLELGADDYITKPFSPREVLARVRAVLRRAEPGALEEATIRVGDLEIDHTRHEVRRAGKLIDLTPTEFKLMEIFARNPRRVFTRLQLVEQVQGYSFEGYERTIDAHVKNLRQKIEKDPKNPRYITTVFGVGYRLEGDGKKG
ncbi:MAG: response regulator transcription factor [Actinomycetota bacterium]